jgi:hypothetical protein
MSERGRVRTVTRLYAFHDPDGRIAEELRRGAPVEGFLASLLFRKVVEGNVFLNEGITFIWQAVTGVAGLTYFNATNSYIGVGDGSVAADPSQTGLQGTNKYYKGMDSGYPQVSGTKVIFRSTFGTAEANFTWAEWTVANGNSDTAVNLNRKVESLGTKTSGATWVLQVELSIS